MNEVNILNIGGIDYNIDDQLARDVIAHSENGLDPQSNLPISSRHYDEGDYLIGQDRLYYEVTSDIEIGDVIAEGVNVRATIISEELVRLKNQSSIAVIQSIAKVESEALSSRNYTVGQYFYWDFGLAAGLYETIATITSGDAFSEGVNIKLANKIADTMDGLQDAYNITGAKNLCPNNAVDTVNHGITYDVLSDGSVNVTGTSDSGGTSSSGNWLNENGITLPAGTYKLTTGQSDEVNAGVTLKAVLKSNTGTTLGISNTNDGIFTLSSPTEVIFGLNTVPPTVSINVRIFPMCRVASITDETYVPFAMTNRQLTSELAAQISNVKTLIPKNYGIDDIPFQRGGDVDANLAYKRVRVFDANSGALPSFAPSGNNDMIVINHWFSDEGINFAIQIAFNIRADNIEYRRFFHNVGWQAWHKII